MPNALPNPIHTLMWNADRAAARRKVSKGSTLRGEDGAPRDIVLEDLSLTGFRVSGHDGLAAGDPILVGLAGVGVREATVVWSNDHAAGCEFLAPISSVEMDRTVSANTVVQGSFAWSRDAGRTQMPEQTPPQRFSLRGRLAIMAVGAVGTWVVVIGLARLAFLAMS